MKPLPFLLLPWIFSTLAAASEKPNILFLMTDQHMAEALSCAGNRYVKTPNLDRLAARGVRFTKSYVAHPLCVPSRASLFSSRMPHELGIYGNTMDAQLAQKGVPTMGDLMKAAGYQTAYAGKWHVHDGFPAFSKKQSIPGFDLLPMGGGRDPRTGDKRTEQKSTLCDPYVTDAAVKFLRERHEKPFLLTVSLLNPHDICEFPYYRGFKAMLPKDEMELPPLRANTRDTEKPPSSLASEKRDSGAWRYGRWTDLEWRQYQWVYYRLVEASDQLLGRILDALEQSTFRDNTIVVYTSDHGEMLGAHQQISKERMYEESVAVPLIIATPGGSASIESGHLVSGLDLMPTFLDLAGAVSPETLRGRSLRPLLEGRGMEKRDYIASEAFDPESRMIRSNRYKYVRYTYGEGREQFFDLDQDPGEMTNLVSKPELSNELERHRVWLAEWMKKTSDEFEKGTVALAKSKNREDEEPQKK